MRALWIAGIVLGLIWLLGRSSMCSCHSGTTDTIPRKGMKV